MIKIKFIQNLSVKNKIVVIILSISFLIHSIGFTFITIWDINRIKSEIQTGLVLNTKLVANNCVVPLTFGDQQQATESLSHLKDIESIETACLYDNQGKLFACYPDTFNSSSMAFHEQQDNVLKDGFFYVKELVVYQNETYGTLFVKANSKPLKIATRNIILTLVLLSIVLDILAIILTNRMQKYISIPILRLKKHFDKIAEYQDFEANITKQNNDEIGSLYDGFNELMSEIQKRSKERDVAELQLKSSKEKLDLALVGGEIGIWEWDFNTDITIWDERMEKMFGLKPGTFGQDYESFKACLHPDDVAATQEAIKNAIEKDIPYNIVYRSMWQNAEIHYISAKAIVSKDTAGKPIKMTGVCLDLSEQKRIEKELQQLNNVLKETGEIAKIGGWDFDVETGVGTWTDEVAKIHDLDPENETNTEIGLSFYTAESRIRIEQAIQQAIANQESYDLDLEIITKKGNRKWVRSIGKPEVKDGKTKFLRGSFQDITRQKQTESEIRKLNEELEQKVKERTNELELKYSELEKMNKIFIGRELKMVELKKTITELEEKVRMMKKE
jgi:PAS domain-containing protein